MLPLALEHPFVYPGRMPSPRTFQGSLLDTVTQDPRFDPTFSESSHGFRPGRSASKAATASQVLLLWSTGGCHSA